MVCDYGIIDVHNHMAEKMTPRHGNPSDEISRKFDEVPGEALTGCENFDPYFFDLLCVSSNFKHLLKNLQKKKFFLTGRLKPIRRPAEPCN